MFFNYLNTLLRFKIPIRVQDSTGTVTLTLFDHEALKFVGKTAKELIEIQDELLTTNELPREYPVKFETLVNLKCAFVIKVTDFNIVNGVENYGISVVTIDVDILDELNKKWKIDQVSDCFINIFALTKPFKRCLNNLSVAFDFFTA
ncbi:putative nucleic acid-binding, replication factor A [Helianthus annuus]|nr:putative nucleic acid-binding, replication factor A [Helianthus annuus]